MIEHDMANSQVENIKKTFLCSENEKINAACAKYLEQDNFIFDKINLNIMSVSMHNYSALRFSIEKFPIMSTTNDESLI